MADPDAPAHKRPRLDSVNPVHKSHALPSPLPSPYTRVHPHVHDKKLLQSSVQVMDDTFNNQYSDQLFPLAGLNDSQHIHTDDSYPGKIDVNLPFEASQPPESWGNGSFRPGATTFIDSISAFNQPILDVFHEYRRGSVPSDAHVMNNSYRSSYEQSSLIDSTFLGPFLLDINQQAMSDLHQPDMSPIDFRSPIFGSTQPYVGSVASPHIVSSQQNALGQSNICAVQSTRDPHVFIFRCTFPRCNQQAFTRWYDYHRHYNGAHAVKKTVFWCPVSGCSRNEGEGHRPFPRKDKMTSHVLKVHGADAVEESV